MDKALKSLEGKNFIKSIHNVKFPSKKVYMLAELTPAEDVTGGAWFTDGVLDAEFIGVLSEYIEMLVSRRTWHEATVKTAAGGASSSSQHKRLKLSSGDGVKQFEVTAEKEKEKIYVPYPADYQYYPTVGEITTEVNKVGITPVKLDEGSISQLLRMMCFDGRLIALNDHTNYKSFRRPNEISKAHADADRPTEIQQKSFFNGKNGMTEAPCGQCPVFKICQPGGTVSPENCEYFDEWLRKALGF